jgi:hypothetical protein
MVNITVPTTAAMVAARTLRHLTSPTNVAPVTIPASSAGMDGGVPVSCWVMAVITAARTPKMPTIWM